jgi:DNA polymerase/3'-5' exonuclease PolX
MSNTTNKMPFATAFEIAQTLVSRLCIYCERIEIAGSIRRQKAQIGDIEIVAIPKGMELHYALGKRLGDGRIRHAEPKRWGDKYRAFVMDVAGLSFPVKVDVFTATPKTWGVQYLIRTGSGVFSRNMVSPVALGGFMPIGYQVQAGRVWCEGCPIETPEEGDVFEAWGMEFIAPSLRMEQYRPTGDAFLPIWKRETVLVDDDAPVDEGQLSLFGDGAADGAAKWRD